MFRGCDNLEKSKLVKGGFHQSKKTIIKDDDLQTITIYKDNDKIYYVTYTYSNQKTFIDCIKEIINK